MRKWLSSVLVVLAVSLALPVHAQTAKPRKAKTVTLIAAHKEALEAVRKSPGLFVSPSYRANAKGEVIELSIAPFKTSTMRDAALEHVAKLTTLKRLTLRLCVSISDKGLIYLSGLNDLESLTIHASSIRGDNLDALKGCTKLRRLSLTRCPLADRNLQHIAQFKDLEELALTHTNITDSGMQQVAKLTKLRSLQLGETRVTDRGLESLKNLKLLERLTLPFAATDKVLPAFASLTRLKTLHLGYPRFVPSAKPPSVRPQRRITAAAVADLITKTQGRSPLDAIRAVGLIHKATPDGQLIWLSLGDSVKLPKIDDNFLPFCSQFSRLKFLELAANAITDAGFANYQIPASLTTLRIRAGSLSGKIAPQLAQQKQLTTLTGLKGFNAKQMAEISKLTELQEVGFSKFTESAGIQHLAKLKKLQVLALRESPLEGDDLKHLKPLSELVNLSLTLTPIGDDALQHVGELTKLQTLDLRRTRVTDKGLTHLANLRSLRNVRVDGTPVTNAGRLHLLRDLQKRKPADVLAALGMRLRTNSEGKVTRLMVTTYGRREPFGDEALQLAGELTELTEVRLMRQNLGSKGVAALATLPKLKYLFLYRCPNVDDAALAHLGKAQTLERLNLYRCEKVTDAGLEHLHDLKKLRTLHLRGTKVSKAAVKSLQAALPRCRISQ